MTKTLWNDTYDNGMTIKFQSVRLWAHCIVQCRIKADLKAGSLLIRIRNKEIYRQFYAGGTIIIFRSEHLKTVSSLNISFPRSCQLFTLVCLLNEFGEEPALET